MLQIARKENCRADVVLVERSCQSWCQGEETKAQGFVLNSPALKWGMLH